MNKKVILDLLFNLLLIFVALFAIAVMQKNTEEQSNNNTDSKNNILISLKWDKDCDLDLWLLLPDGRKVFYSQRDQPPAFLDIDIIAWQNFTKPNGETITIKNNEEIISIKEVISGEYVVNVHLFNIRDETDIPFDISIYDVKHRRLIYADKRILSTTNRQEHIARFTTEESSFGFRIIEVIDNNPLYFVGN